MLNRVVLIGRLTHDPELRYTPNGIPLAKFTLAVDRPFQANKKDKETDFIRIVCWRSLAERCKEHLGKGRLVAIDGRLQIRNWESTQGERRSTAEVYADDVRFLDRAPSRTEEGEFTHEAPPPPSPQKDYGQITDHDIDEEIDLSEEPF